MGAAILVLAFQDALFEKAAEAAAVSAADDIFESEDKSGETQTNQDRGPGRHQSDRDWSPAQRPSERLTDHQREIEDRQQSNAGRQFEPRHLKKTHRHQNEE